MTKDEQLDEAKRQAEEIVNIAHCHARGILNDARQCVRKCAPLNPSITTRQPKFGSHEHIYGFAVYQALRFIFLSRRMEELQTSAATVTLIRPRTLARARDARVRGR